ncbi:uncharacterized protein [Prorops nasuta]|uniref:uncharacterized protein n=1 Tax=Prorops nasuta TaxID=863751 RepID=UPI0034CF3516
MSKETLAIVKYDLVDGLCYMGSIRSLNNQQGNYQQRPTQQGNYKQGNVQNSQAFRQQQQQPNQGQTQQSPSRSMQMMSQNSAPQQQQSQSTATISPQPPRLKPILKQNTTHAAPGQATNSAVSSIPAPTHAPNTSLPSSVTSASEDNGNNLSMESTDNEQQDQHKWRKKVPGLFTNDDYSLRKFEDDIFLDVPVYIISFLFFIISVLNFIPFFTLPILLLLYFLLFLVKVNKKLKRLRLNQRLRKTLQPKNAIMVLNEMKAGVQFTFPESQGNLPSSLYVVHAELDGKTYIGQGLSKPLARQNAAENALKSLLLEKMTAASMKARIDAETDGNQSNDGPSVKTENSDESTPMDTNTDENDEIPWSSLASFALYKLFLEWHNQGTSVPIPRPGIPPSPKGLKKETQAAKSSVQKELPSNATSIHPVMLLNQMKPGLTYTEVNRVGNPPNIMFTLAVEIDGVQYTGSAKNKKDAKKVAAKHALQSLFDLSYPADPSDQTEDYNKVYHCNIFW